MVVEIATILDKSLRESIFIISVFLIVFITFSTGKLCFAS